MLSPEDARMETPLVAPEGENVVQARPSLSVKREESVRKPISGDRVRVTVAPGSGAVEGSWYSSIPVEG